MAPPLRVEAEAGGLGDGDVAVLGHDGVVVGAGFEGHEEAFEGGAGGQAGVEVEGGEEAGAEIGAVGDEANAAGFGEAGDGHAVSQCVERFGGRQLELGEGAGEGALPYG